MNQLLKKRLHNVVGESCLGKIQFALDMYTRRVYLPSLWKRIKAFATYIHEPYLT